jgi:outer membrane protein
MRGCFLLAALVLFSAPARAETHTLEQALVLAYQHDPGLQAQRAKLRATDEQVSQALSNYRPSIDATDQVGKTTQHVAENPFIPTSSNLTPRDAGLTITQPVFRGFRTTASVDSAKATVKAGRATLQQAEEQLLLDAAKAYVDVLQAQDLVQITRKNETDLQTQLEATQDRFRIGELKKTDVSQAQSRLKAAMVARLQAEGDLANKRLTFARLTGEMPGTLQAPLLALDRPQDAEEAAALAEEHNPAVIAAQYTQEAASADVTTAKGSLLPEVNLVGSATRNQDQTVTLPQRQSSLTALVSVTIPLYRSGTDYSKTRAALDTETQRRLEYDDARNKAREGASNAWQTLVTARAAIAGDQEAEEATEQALVGVKEEAKIGTRTTLDVLNAEQELLNARVNLVKARHEETVAILQVKAAIGDLTAEALRLPVDLYNPVTHYDNARNRWIGFGDAGQP